MPLPNAFRKLTPAIDPTITALLRFESSVFPEFGMPRWFSFDGRIGGMGVSSIVLVWDIFAEGVRKFR